LKTEYVVKAGPLPNFKHNLKASSADSPDFSESSDLEQFDQSGNLPVKIIRLFIRKKQKIILVFYQDFQHLNIYQMGNTLNTFTF
jgi:hypothetical protein